MMSNLEKYLMPGSLKIWSQYESEIREFFNECRTDFIYGQKRDNCGVVAASFYMFMKEKGVDFNRVRGDFVTDKGVFTKLDFYKEDLVEMKKISLDPNKLEDRMQFVETFNLHERQKRIPHYWNVDKNGLIVDLSGYSQFVKSSLALDLNISRYEEENLVKKPNIKP